jgi:CBS domain-containing protein
VSPVRHVRRPVLSFGIGPFGSIRADSREVYDIVRSTLNDVMTTDLVACDARTPLRDVARLMRDRDIGDVLVTDDGHLAGIVTDRDLVVRCLAEGADTATATASNACSPHITTGTPDMTVEDAAKLMAGQRHPPSPGREGRPSRRHRQPGRPRRRS